MAILTIARLTLREASRRRLLLAAALLVLVAGLLSAWGFHRLLDIPCGDNRHLHACPPTEQKLVAATMLIMLMFMFSFVMALGAAFVAAPAISADVESGIMLAMLPRPIRRSDVIVGKWLGLAVFLTVYAALACAVEFTVVRIAMNYEPPHPVLATLFIIGEALIVLTLGMLLSTRLSAMTGGIIALALFGMMWMGGIAGEVGAALHVRAIENAGTISSLILPTDGLWRGAIYNLEPVSVIVVGSGIRAAAANPFFVSAPPTNAYLLWALGWVLGLLAISIWSFNRREL